MFPANVGGVERREWLVVAGCLLTICVIVVISMTHGVMF